MALREVIKSFSCPKVSLIPLDCLMEPSDTFSFVIGGLFSVMPFNLVFVGSTMRFVGLRDWIGRVLLGYFFFFNQQFLIIFSICDGLFVDDRCFLGVSRSIGTSLNDFRTCK